MPRFPFPVVSWLLRVAAVSVAWPCAASPLPRIPVPVWTAATPFKGDLPEPPAQRLAWTAPESTLPAEYVSAATTLFRQGLADPRGCEYREMVVVTGSVWGPRLLTETHGWILPGYGKARFGIAWNGLVYPLVAIGAPADLRADITMAMNGGPSRYAMSEEASMVAWDTVDDLKGCLLLRLGEVDLARRMWTICQIKARAWGNEPLPDASTTPLTSGDPYREWAFGWAWSVFDRGLCAHMRGDDSLALSGARGLTTLQPLLEAEMIRRQERLAMKPRKQTGRWSGSAPPLYFLGPLAVLLKDQERRAAEPARPSSLEVIRRTAPPAAERTRLLIADLDRVEVRQWSQPGGLGPATEDPIVKALVAEGDLAVEPLIACLESDAADHLTRSVSFSRDFHTDRHLWTVRMPVEEALLAVMKTSREVIGYRYGAEIPRREVASLFRNYWERYGRESEMERWYRQLADDTPGPSTWSDVLQRIVRKDASGRMAGEDLRNKSNPSVAELLVKRASFLTELARHGGSTADGTAIDPLNFVLQSMRWDSSALLPAAATLMQIQPENGHSLSDMARLATARADVGDLPALEEWGRWIVTREPGDLFRGHDEKLTPLFSYPGHPAMQAVAKALLSDPDGKWWRSYRERPFADSDEALLLLIVPEARECWRQSLADTEKLGTVEVTGEGELSFRTATGTYGRGADREAGKLPTGTKQEVRRCDEWADRLQAVRGFSAFCPAWPLEKRDAAIAEMRRILAEDGARFKLLGEKERDDLFSPRVRLEPR